MTMEQTMRQQLLLGTNQLNDGLAGKQCFLRDPR
jgi:hypothetical protein